ncbi:cation/H(+) antiporter 15-like [Corylus avellana]|uniref:cation/H(+) antiporter 15-like n=1 Tax=Corylus avellana TaxID=13451 RepID=UPI00286A6BD8|nr:cation/H(+) antiporter 15-like [Corylus avellana]
MVVETMANLGLLFYVFLTGLEMDLSAILRPRKRVMGIAITGILIPFLLGVGLFFLLQYRSSHITPKMGCVFWAAALTVTGFPVLTHILTDLKLLHSDIGRIAMSVAMLNDIYAWVLIAILIPTGVGMKTTPQSLTGVVAFILICFLAVRPFLERIIRIESEKDNYSEYHLCFVLAGALMCACITDLLGAQSIVGAFVFGLIMPNGEFGDVLLDRLDDFVSGIMLPFFFVSWGIKIDFNNISRDTTWYFVMLVICFAFMAKILSSLIICILFKMPLRDGAALGVLMNTKGILALVILNTGWNKKILNDQQFTVMVVAIVAMTIVVAPIMSAIYKHRKGLKQYRLRTIQRQKPDTELRVLACVYTTANVSGIISLLQVSHATKLSPITIFALHLVELTGRASAMLIVHSRRKSGAHNPSRAQADSNLIINAFEAFERDNHLFTVQPLTAMSLYSTMHEDICSVAQDKRVSLILLPFHKHLTVGGRMEDENVAYRDINLNVLANAPCSVGIFIDRGLAAADINVKRRFCMLFIGGGDDREALAYAWRMAGHPGISLTVVRFLPDEDAILSLDTTENDKETIDEDYINEFRFKSASEESIMYLEKVVNNGEETVSAISAMENSYDLYIVGKGAGKVSPLLSGLSEWSDCPELGVIGDVLMSSTFALQASVLVVQQYGSSGGMSEESRRDRFGLRQRMMGVLRSSQSGKGMVLSDGDWPIGNA